MNVSACFVFLRWPGTTAECATVVKQVPGFFLSFGRIIKEKEKLLEEESWLRTLIWPKWHPSTTKGQVYFLKYVLP